MKRRRRGAPNKSIRFESGAPHFQYHQFDSKLSRDNTPYDGGKLGAGPERATPVSIEASKLIHGDRTLNGRLRAQLAGPWVHEVLES